MVSEAHYEVHIRQASIHTARTSDVDSVMFVNRIRKISYFLILFFLFRARNETKKIFLYFFTKLKPYLLFYSI